MRHFARHPPISNKVLGEVGHAHHKQGPRGVTAAFIKTQRLNRLLLEMAVGATLNIGGCLSTLQQQGAPDVSGSFRKLMKFKETITPCIVRINKMAD